jgi:hypothetical protein
MLRNARSTKVLFVNDTSFLWASENVSRAGDSRSIWQFGFIESRQILALVVLALPGEGRQGEVCLSLA